MSNRAENLISARIVKRPRVPRWCDHCGEDMGTGPHVRMYGSAHRPDPPFVVRVHPGCLFRGWDDRVDAVIDRATIAATPERSEEGGDLRGAHHGTPTAAEVDDA